MKIHFKSKFMYIYNFIHCIYTLKGSIYEFITLPLNSMHFVTETHNTVYKNIKQK